MHDEDVKAFLSRFRPVPPAADLRQRALFADVYVARAWPWSLAAAALLALTIGLHVASSHVVIPYVPDDDSAQSVVTLADAIGGDRNDALRLAQAVLRSIELQRARGDSRDLGGGREGQ